MSHIFRQSVACTSDFFNGPGSSFTIPSTVAGDNLYVFIQCFAGAVPSLTGSFSSYTTSLAYDDGTYAIYALAVRNIAGGLTSLTVSMSSFSQVSPIVVEMSGGQTSSDPKDVTNSATFASTAGPQSGSNTTVADNDAMFMWIVGDSPKAYAAGSGYTIVQESGSAFGVEWKEDVGAHGANTPSISWTGGNISGAWGTVSYKAAAAAGGAFLAESDWQPLEPQTNPLVVSVW